jgi:hypothetical protein
MDRKVVSTEENESEIPARFYATESTKTDQISPSGKWAVIVTASFFTG